MTTLEHPGRAPTGTPSHGLGRYKSGPDENGRPGKGCRCPVCATANKDWQANRARLIAYRQWTGWLPAAGTQRRLQALMYNGWSWPLLAARLGCTRQSLRVIACHRAHATQATITAVRALYRELWLAQPPERTRFERAAATKARQYARDHGWCPPAAWDDDQIDDPAAGPVPGWDQDGTTRRYGVLAEDAAFLLASGEEPQWVAERLGVCQGTISVTLARAARKQQAEASRAA